MNVSNSLAQVWAKADRPSVRAFFLSIAALSVALILALYSGAAAQLGNLALASGSAIVALLVAGWVAVTLVPTLAKRTPLRWIGYRMEYKITRAGWIYIGGIALVALAAINTGNNLLFLILASLVASILMSGVLSSVTLAGVELRLSLPGHMFAGQQIRASVTLQNEKLTLPSFSLRVEGVKEKEATATAVLENPVYFPYLPRHESMEQHVPLLFPGRGIYRQEAFRIVTRFPFGFLQKARRVDLASEALVYPSVEETPELLEILPGMHGAMESFAKGHGQDLYALRDYVSSDSARHVHWKASARTGALMVREFAREEDSRVLLVFDPYSSGDRDNFERAVSLCAAIAWSFHERGATMEFRTIDFHLAPAPASESIFAILGQLALIQPAAPGPSREFLSSLAGDFSTFRILVTTRPHGSIPGVLWPTSYVIFSEDLAR